MLNVLNTVHALENDSCCFNEHTKLTKNEIEKASQSPYLMLT